MDRKFCKKKKLGRRPKHKYYPFKKTFFQMTLWGNNFLTKQHDTTIKYEKEAQPEVFNIDILNWITNVLYPNVATVAPEKEIDLQRLTKGQILAMATFVPNELINIIRLAKPYTSIAGVLMFADISGFTTLCEKYASLGPEGAFKLTATLNAYLGSMVDILYRCGGDLLKFAGDAFIAIWRLCADNYTMGDKADEAINCAIRIQSSLGSFMCDVDVTLKVKISISAGNFIFCLIGDHMTSTYVVYGLPVLEAKKGEGYCSSGDIVISPSVYNCINKTKYYFQKITKGYLKLKRVLDPEEFKRHSFDHEFLESRGYFRSSATIKKLIESTMKSIIDLEELGTNRPMLQCEFLLKMGTDLRPFILDPVLNQIVLNSTFKPITEMRQVTIMFIRFKPRSRLETEHLRAVSVFYTTVVNSVKNYYGLVNKLILYDKDVMLLAIFGMKGYKQKSETKRCLQCAASIRSQLRNHHLIEDLSVGVTVGSPFCGVVGHLTRKEFTIIGRPVNKAARLMCRFRDMISCDLDVVRNSRLPMHYFKKLETVHLKGMGHVKDIFQYLEIKESLAYPPLLGRSEVMNKFEDLLKDANKSNGGILVLGESRIGKTRLLTEFSAKADQLGWHRVWVTLRAAIRNDVCLLHFLIAAILGRTIDERSALLINMFKDSEWYDKLYLLNKKIDVKFSRPHNGQIEENEDKSFRKLFIEVMNRLEGRLLLMIDDAHALDRESWTILIQTIDNPNILSVVTVPNTWKVSDGCVFDFVNHPSVIGMRLEGLNIQDIGPLAGQIMHVQAVPQDLPKFLLSLSGGNPGWINTFLISYLNSNLLLIESQKRTTLNKFEFLYISSKHLARDSLIRTRLRRERYISVCKFSPEFNEKTVPVVFDDVFLAIFDKLCEFDQTLLKSASIVGERFRRIVLLAVMDHPDNIKVWNAYVRLFQMYLITCDSSKLRRKTYGRLEAVCYCPGSNKATLSTEVFPKYAFCSYSRFNYSMFRSSLYNIVPSNQRKEGHVAVVRKVKTLIRKCSVCLENERLLEKMDEKFELSTSDKEESDSSLLHRETARRKLRGSRLTFWESRRLPSKFLGRAPHKMVMGKIVQAALERELNKEGIKYDITPFIFSFPRIMECTCHQLLYGIYKELIYHSEAAGIKDILIKFLIDCAEQSFRRGKFKEAAEFLKKAKEEYLKCVAEHKIKQNFAFTPMQEIKVKVDRSQLKFAYTKIRIKLAITYFYLGQLAQAEALIEETGKHKNPFLILIASFFLPFLSGNALDKMNSMLALKCELFITLSKMNMFETKIKQAVRTGLISTYFARRLDDLYLRSDCFCNYLDLAITIGKMKLTRRLEEQAIHSCIKYYFGREGSDLISIGELFCAVFKSRFYRGKFLRASATGLAALQFTSQLQAIDAEFHISPLLIHCFIRLMKFEELELIFEKISAFNQESDFNFVHLYHQVNIEMWLETGISVEPVMHSVDQFRLAGMFTDISPDYTFARKIATSVRLLYLRIGNFKKAKTFAVETFSAYDYNTDYLPKTMKMLESKLIILVHEIDRKKNIDEIDYEIRVQFLLLSRIFSSNIKVLYTDYLIYKAYYKIIYFRYHWWKCLPGYKNLNRAFKIANKQGNLLAKIRIKKNIEYWFDTKEWELKEIEESAETMLIEKNLKEAIDERVTEDMLEEILEDCFPVLPLPLKLHKHIAKLNEKKRLYARYAKIFHNKYF